MFKKEPNSYCVWLFKHLVTIPFFIFQPLIMLIVVFWFLMSAFAKTLRTMNDDNKMPRICKVFKLFFGFLLSFISSLILSVIIIIIIAVPMQIIFLIFISRYSYIWCCISRKPRKRLFEEGAKQRLVRLRHHSEETGRSGSTDASGKMLIRTLESDPSYTSILVQTPETTSILN